MKSTKLERTGWYLFDWGNSAFSTTIVTVFLGPYITVIAKNASDSAGFIHPLGIPIFHGSYFSYIISLSVILQVIFLPWFGAIADFTKSKKTILGIFAYIGSICSACFYFLEGNNYIFGGVLFVIANLSFGISVVMYNAYLNDIAEKEETDSISSKGWAIGYIGGGILLALNLMLYSNSRQFGISESYAVRISLCSAGLWWGIFTIFPMIWLKVRSSKYPIKRGNYFKIGINRFIVTMKELRKYKKTMYFLIAYLCYNDGIQAVLTMASLFGKEELGLEIETLLKVILLVQFIGFFGSLYFNKIAEIFSTKKAIIVTLIIWNFSIFYAFLFMKTSADFYILGIIIGFIMGGTQALSRSMFSQLIPKGNEAEFFSLYEISDKGTSWLAPLLFGLCLQFTNSYRYAILSLIIFFIIGLLMMFRFNYEKAKEDLVIFTDK